MEMRNEFLRKLKRVSLSKISNRDLTIGDVAHAQQSESKLSLPSLNRNIALRKFNSQADEKKFVGGGNKNHEKYT